jgi:hypothetical protein
VNSVQRFVGVRFDVRITLLSPGGSSVVERRGEAPCTTIFCPRSGRTGMVRSARLSAICSRACGPRSSGWRRAITTRRGSVRSRRQCDRRPPARTVESTDRIRCHRPRHGVRARGAPRCCGFPVPNTRSRWRYVRAGVVGVHRGCGEAVRIAAARPVRGLHHRRPRSDARFADRVAGDGGAADLGWGVKTFERK